jgi:hypothetical protein
MKMSMRVSECDECGCESIGTHGVHDDGSSQFFCANCARPEFDEISSLQKEAYLAGENPQFDVIYGC